MADSPTAASASARRPAYRVRVERIFDHNADTRSLFLRLMDGGRLQFIPGQFISISLPLESGTRVRPYTIASSPEQTDAIEICFNDVPGGAGVRYLFGRRVGDELEFTGPFGAFTIDRPPAGHCVFIAETTAIAPIRPMVRRLLLADPRPALSFLYGSPDSDHLLYGEETRRWASAGVEFIPLLAPAADLYSRLAAEAYRRWVEADADRSRHFFLCGVGQGVIGLRDLLRGAGYERRAVHYERW
jgi:glycine betaine monooxygenase B